MADKKGVSLIVSYVILISLVIGLSIGVYVWLKDYTLITEKIDCKEGTSLFLDDYNCSADIFNLSLKNNGYFNISGFIMSVSNESGRAPIELLNATGTGTEGFPLGHYFFDPPLKPGETREAVFIKKDNVSVIQIQPFILDKKLNKIMCEQAVIRQNVNCIGEAAPPGFDPLTLPGFVSWWRFNETSGIIADDFVGNNNGTLYNMDNSDWVSGKSGNALDFDGSNDYVNVIDSTNLRLNMTGTLSAWIYPRDLYRHSIINKRGPSTNNANYVENYWLLFGATSLAVIIGDGSANYMIANYGIGNFSVNNWYHVVGVWNSSNIMLYVNGNMKNIQANTLTSVTQGALPLRIGFDSRASWYFNGSIDEVMVFNTALSQQNISDIYNYFAG